MPKDRRRGRRPRVPTETELARMEQALSLVSSGLTYRQAAPELGVSTTTLGQIIDRAVQTRLNRSGAREVRGRQLDELDRIRRRASERLASDDWAKAAEVLLKVQKREADLLGTDPSKTVTVRWVSVDALEAEEARLDAEYERMLAERDRAIPAASTISPA
jgi:transposase